MFEVFFPVGLNPLIASLGSEAPVCRRYEVDYTVNCYYFSVKCYRAGDPMELWSFCLRMRMVLDASGCWVDSN